jgi:GT2 family glycosyltransferase
MIASELDQDVSVVDPFVSVVICTLNRHADLLRTLTYFAEEEPYRPFEVIVVDQSDEIDSESKALIEKNSDRFQIVRRSEKHLAKARNVGLQFAKGEIIIFVDDDVDILSGFLAAHVAAFVDLEIWGATGPVFDPGNHKLVSAQSLTQMDIDGLKSGQKVIRADFAYDIGTLAGGNMAIRRSAFDKIGDFDEFYENYCDDVEISYRIKLAGGRLRYMPAAQLVHYGRQTGGVRTMSLARFIRNYVRSVVFFDLQSASHQFSILRLFRVMILSRRGYSVGQLGFHQTIAFWQGVADARREFNRRSKSKKFGAT